MSFSFNVKERKPISTQTLTEWLMVGGEPHQSAAVNSKWVFNAVIASCMKIEIRFRN